MIYLSNAARKFLDIGIPGVGAAPIWRENGAGADLVRFEAGARFPYHDHEGPEQIMMLSGRVRFGDLILSAGDYLKVGPGCEHDVEALEDSVFFIDHVGGAIIKE